MPTYDYRCNACEHTFEEFQMMSEAVLKKCPKCGKLKLERLIGSGAGIIFKGSGYYSTDYRDNKSYDAAKKADSAPSSDSTSSDSGSSPPPSS